MSGRKVRTALERVGFVFLRQKGSHMILYRATPPAWVTVSDHRQLKAGTLRGIVADAELTVDAFVQLLK